MKLIPSLEFISTLYSDSNIVYIDGDEHAAVIDIKDTYRIVGFQVGDYLIEKKEDYVNIYYGKAIYRSENPTYLNCYQVDPHCQLVNAPKTLILPQERFRCSFFENFCLVKDRQNKQCLVFDADTEGFDKPLLTLPYRYPKQHQGALYFDNFSSIVALDDNFNERWTIQCKNSRATGFQRSHFFADNYFIYVSFLEEPNSLSPWPGDTVNAVCLDTGKTLWSTTFDDPVMSVMHHRASSQSEAAIYIGTDKHCIVLNAETGKQRLKFASPYNVMDMKPIFLDDGSYQGELRSESRVWTDGHFIYFTGNSGGWSHYGADQLHLYRMDGSDFSGPIQIPPAYRFDAVKQCFHLNGKSYIPVSSASQAFNLVDFGVIIIDPLTLTPESDIELEAGPVRELVHRVHDKKTESYQLKVIADETADNARDDLIRFSEIETKRIAVRFGDQLWTNKEKNKKFNGQIQLIITGSEKMKLDCQAMLDILVERVHIWAVESEIDAGNRKEPIKVSWQWIEG
ncbi:hypothetical protein [Shewanella sp. 10N.286.48.A6]|uniref:hypothetical protein n=1 Tax=Shewanella sp. 10N.286.48.A6 TaxID=1880833 RepID=UPI000C83AC45|nr:hypothetical protein [Shewanella sp. 10N.286.48.A6]PMH96972.1 hypothetical protein BCU55_19125 [Shewanella sp. 10N.286.48.A6]